MPHLHPDPAAATAPSLTADARAALAELAAATPEWRPWLALLEIALAEADHDSWRTVDIRFAAARPVDAPLLEGARTLVDAPAAGRTVRALLAGAVPDEAPGPDAPGPDARGPGLDPLALLAAGLRQDDEALGRLAAIDGLPDAPLATVAHFAVMPLLLEAARRAADALPPDWRHGYCPTCGAWPTLAELRGLERRRVLRCGRCATGWEGEVLRCPFCGERDHRRQGALVPESGGERARVETCESCRGYLKTVTTLRPKPAWALPLEDLRTLPLELTVVERGYRRPDRPGWTLEVAVGPALEGR